MKILFIACYSPLINNSAAIETLQYLNNLIKEGNEIDLLTVDFSKDCIYYDENLVKYIDEKIVVHRINGGKIFNSIIPKKQNNLPSENSNTSAFRKVLRKAKNLLVIPDMYYTWSKNAAEYGKKLMEEKKFDIIFSMHEPPSSHLCALQIKRDNKDIPWVTYWSDPWLKDSTREKAIYFKKVIEKKMEKEVIELADSFIFVTRSNMDDYINTYNLSVEKCHVITRGYDAEVYRGILEGNPPLKIKNDKLNLVYPGEIFSKLRNINPFIDALEELRSEDGKVFNKFNILFFGNIDDTVAKQRLGLLENVYISGRIPYNEALKYILFSEGLLIFGNKNSKQIPAKIYDYFGAKGKIATILGDKNDPIKGVVENNIRCINALNNKDDIKIMLKHLIFLYENNNVWGEEVDKYEWKNISKKLNKILEES